MFDIEKWQEIFATIRRNKLRTALTALSVYWGIFMLIFMSGAGNGLRNGASQNLKGFATNSGYVWGRKTTKAHEGFKPGRMVRFDLEDVAAIRQSVPEILHLAPRCEMGEIQVKYRKKTGLYRVNGDVPAMRALEAIELDHGRQLNEPDQQLARKVAVVGKRIVDILFDGKDPVGQYIQIRGVHFLVVGVTKTYRKGDRAQEDEKSIYVPLSALQQTFNMKKQIHYFGFSVQPTVPVEPVEKKIRAKLASMHHIHPEDKNAIGSENMEKEFGKFQGIFMGIDALIWFVGICTIIAGVVSVSNIMLIVVKERTREIGLRKALGATPWSIISLILQESVFITTVSGYFGLVIGIGLVEGIRILLENAGGGSEYFSNPQVDMPIVLTATALLVVAGGLAGLLPALKAASVSPVEALRDE